MKNSGVFLLFLLVVCGLFLVRIVYGVEEFGATSPGTMVQLQTSHVPTQVDVDYFNFVLPKVVRKDITSMTGEDPGELKQVGIPLGGAYVLA